MNGYCAEITLGIEKFPNNFGCHSFYQIKDLTVVTFDGEQYRCWIVMGID